MTKPDTSPKKNNEKRYRLRKLLENGVGMADEFLKKYQKEHELERRFSEKTRELHSRLRAEAQYALKRRNDIIAYASARGCMILLEDPNDMRNTNPGELDDLIS